MQATFVLTSLYCTECAWSKAMCWYRKCRLKIKREEDRVFWQILPKKRRKSEANSLQNKSRVYLGNQLDRWNTLKEELGVKTGNEVAKVLLDRLGQHFVWFCMYKALNHMQKVVSCCQNVYLMKCYDYFCSWIKNNIWKWLLENVNNIEHVQHDSYGAPTGNIFFTQKQKIEN